MNNVLLVEGTNDYHVVGALCRAHGVALTLFETLPCGSDLRALKKLNGLIMAPDTDRPPTIGLVLDADQPDVQGRWQSIQDRLREHLYPLPNQPAATGTIVAATRPELPRLGFWLMPDNRQVGMLEDLVLEMIAPHCVQTVEQCLREARTGGCVTYREVHQSKAVVHTFLAWQNEPGRPIGQAITAGALRPDTATALQFTAWLTDLFAN